MLLARPGKVQRGLAPSDVRNAQFTRRGDFTVSDSHQQRIDARSVLRKRQEHNPIEDVDPVVRFRSAVADRLARRKNARDVVLGQRQQRASQSLPGNVWVEPLLGKTARLSVVTDDRHDQAAAPVVPEFLRVEGGPAGEPVCRKPLPNGMDALDSPALFRMIRHDPLRRDRMALGCHRRLNPVSRHDGKFNQIPGLRTGLSARRWRLR